VRGEGREERERRQRRVKEEGRGLAWWS